MHAVVDPSIRLLIEPFTRSQCANDYQLRSSLRYTLPAHCQFDLHLSLSLSLAFPAIAAAPLLGMSVDRSARRFLHRVVALQNRQRFIFLDNVTTHDDDGWVGDRDSFDMYSPSNNPKSQTPRVQTTTTLFSSSSLAVVLLFMVVVLVVVSDLHN